MLSVAIQSDCPDINLCPACNSGMLTSDRFCRRCGARKIEEASQGETLDHSNTSQAKTKEFDDLPSFATVSLTEDLYHMVSRPLVKSVTERLTANKTGRLKGRWSKGLILALISIPIWLMIVLLSPLDAYTAAKSTVEQR